MSSTHNKWGGVLTTAGMILCLAGSASGQADVFHQRVKVAGLALAWAGDCPDFAPTVPMTCTEWAILLFGETSAVDGAGVAPPTTPWFLDVLHHTLTFAGDDSEPTETNVGRAVIPVTDFSLDARHLSSADVHVENAVLDDGTMVNLTAIWTAITSTRIVYGNDSPVNEGIPVHFHEPCFTTNNLGNQISKSARMSAVVNNIPYEYDGVGAVIAKATYQYIWIEPSKCVG